MFAAVLLAGGCGGRGVEQVHVTGKVTLDGKPMPGPGTLYFNPTKAAGDEPKLPGTAEFGADGEYAAMTFEPGDGLVPGSYKVAVHCWEVSPNEEGRAAKSFIPKKYTSAGTSGFELVVPENTSSHTFNVPLSSE